MWESVDLVDERDIGVVWLVSGLGSSKRERLRGFLLFPLQCIYLALLRYDDFDYPRKQSQKHKRKMASALRSPRTADGMRAPHAQVTGVIYTQYLNSTNANTVVAFIFL